jgi:hypothetical protein
LGDHVRDAGLVAGSAAAGWWYLHSFNDDANNDALVTLTARSIASVGELLERLPEVR